MKIAKEYLSGEELAPVWSEPFIADPDTEPEKRTVSPFDGLALQIRIPRVSEWRARTHDENDEPRKLSQAEALALYTDQIVGWNVEDQEYTVESLVALLDRGPGLEGWMASEVEAARRFRRQSRTPPAEAAPVDSEAGEAG